MLPFIIFRVFWTSLYRFHLPAESDLRTHPGMPLPFSSVLSNLSFTMKFYLIFLVLSRRFLRKILSYQSWSSRLFSQFWQQVWCTFQEYMSIAIRFESEMVEWFDTQHSPTRVVMPVNASRISMTSPRSKKLQVSLTGFAGTATWKLIPTAAFPSFWKLLHFQKNLNVATLFF